MRKLLLASAAVALFPLSAHAVPTIIDFDTDGMGNPISTGNVGQIIDTEYANLGVTFSAVGGQNLAITYDTTQTDGEDPDLEQPFSPGNQSGFGNILVVAAANGQGTTPVCDAVSCIPSNDQAGGADIIAMFANPVTVTSFQYFDQEENEFDVVFTDVNNVETTLMFPGGGNGSTANSGNIDLANITKIVWELPGSGGIDNLIFEANEVPEPATLGLIGAGLIGAHFLRRRRAA